MIKPYADDAGAMQIGELQVENGTDRVALYGSIDLTRDKQGLEHARKLRDLLAAVVKSLETETDLPDQIPPPKPTDTVDNPFK
ncbi:hypothetical protein VH569_28345 [Azospirillum sp. 11R-A]|uniref:hypothetical protein n=1 Tax=unclassified Azospirillum TaxID=2630922 RepID=UPI000D60BDD1|nr:MULTISPECIES: hypothetical protein [unclassified Azospirillum]PWC60778.1 hypothetical protein TSH20_24715 [Azospirillum sp. TSH20]PWC67292.1 hypothetical protein TSH7_04670 [Azospirillum sp. TSH7]QCG94427.1 hypothetical protein E6C67_10865 [Azospirillum sp. TSA2s]